MPKQVQLKSGTTLTIEDKPFASGGEGDLFRIISPQTFQNQVVKVYFPEKRTKEREQKIDFLVSNPPSLQVQNGYHSVIWATQTVYDNGNFLGFIMPTAKGEKLELLCHAKLPQNLSSEWKKFDFQNVSSAELRLKICFNIAVALYQIHSLGNYVLVDMKPENIMIQPNGLISIIDIDSVEVVKNGKVIFPAPVATPEYTPPEYYRGIKPEKDGASEIWDRFSLAVIFYRLLCGIHPFTGTCKTPFDKCSGLPEMVENGLFPNGNKNGIFKVIPPPHNNFKKLGKQIQSLFLRCFDEGHTSPYLRPSADEWCRVLSPLPTIQINRPLPSTLVGFPNYTLSNLIVFNPNTHIDIPNINYLNIAKEKGFKSVITFVFGKSDKKKLGELITLKENNIKALTSQFVEFSKALQLIINLFNNQQIQIQQQEKNKFEQLRNSFNSELLSIDEYAKILNNQEIQELHQAQIDLNSKLVKIDNEIKGLFQVHLQPIENQYNTNLSSIQQQISSLQEQENTEVKKIENSLQVALQKVKQQLKEVENEHFKKIDDEINEKLSKIIQKRREIENKEHAEKGHLLENIQELALTSNLANYKISDYATTIFNDSYADPDVIVSNLRRSGIVTAADFTAVNESGEIKKTNGGWIKVSQVGGYRAKSLGSWRNRMERNLPTAVPQTIKDDELKKIKKKYEPDYQKLDAQEQEIRNEALTKKASISSIMAEKVKDANKNEQQLKQTAQTSKENIKANFVKLRQKLESNFQILQNEFYQTITPIRQKIDTEKLVFQQQQIKVKEDYKNIYDKVKLKYDILNETNNKKAKQLEQLLSHKFTVINNETAKKLNENLQKHSKESTQKRYEISNFTTNLNIEIANLKDLQEKYVTN